MRLLIRCCLCIVTVDTNLTLKNAINVVKPAHCNEWEGLRSATLIAAGLREARGQKESDKMSSEDPVSDEK